MSERDWNFLEKAVVDEMEGMVDSTMAGERILDFQGSDRVGHSEDNLSVAAAIAVSEEVVVVLHDLSVMNCWIQLEGLERFGRCYENLHQKDRPHGRLDQPLRQGFLFCFVTGRFVACQVD